MRTAESSKSSSTARIRCSCSGIDDREIYVPAVDEFIVETDLENGVIRFDLPDGLIDLND